MALKVLAKSVNLICVCVYIYLFIYLCLEKVVLAESNHMLIETSRKTSRMFQMFVSRDRGINESQQRTADSQQEEATSSLVSFRETSVSEYLHTSCGDIVT